MKSCRCWGANRASEIMLRTTEQNLPLYLCHNTKLGFGKLMPPLPASGSHCLFHQNEQLCFLKTHKPMDRILGSFLNRFQNTPNLWQEQQKYSIYHMIFTLIFKSHWMGGKIWITAEFELWEHQGNVILGFLVFNAVIESPEPAFIPCWNFISMMVGTHLLIHHPSPVLN